MTDLAAYRFWKHALLWLGVFLILAARVPLLWQGGQFTGEDGWVFFAGAFNAPWHESLFVPFAGYFRFDARLLAELLSGWPLELQPALFGGVGLALNAVVLTAFYAPVFRNWIASDTLRVGLVLLLSLAPNAENLGLFTGLHWYVAFGVVLVLLVPWPEAVPNRFMTGVFLTVGVWSSPSVLVLVPWMAWRAGRADGRSEKYVFAAAAGQGLLAAVAAFMLLDPADGRSGEFALGHLPAALDVLLLRGWLAAGALGQTVAEILGNRLPWVLSLVGLTIGGSLLYWVLTKRSKKHGRMVGLLLAVAVGMAGLSLFRTAYVTELATLGLPRHVRYLTVPTLLLLVGSWIALSQVMQGSARRSMIVLWSIQVGLLIAGLARNQHWSRATETFRWSEQIAAVEEFRNGPLAAAEPASLYLPNDIPYWGIVLESAGGLVRRPDEGVVAGLDADEIQPGLFSSWLGDFRFSHVAEDPAFRWIYHQHLGELRYTGVEAGQAWFVDAAGVQWFTSPLLQPYWWRIDELDMRLMVP